MAVPRPAADRPPRPSVEAPKQKQRSRAARWHQRVDAAVAYAPHGSGTAAGLAGYLVSGNKAVGFGMFVAVQTADVVKTFWERREKKRKEKRDAD
jgi:hypothetical protein